MPTSPLQFPCRVGSVLLPLRKDCHLAVVRVRENGSAGLNISKLVQGADFCNSPRHCGLEPGESLQVAKRARICPQEQASG